MITIAHGQVLREAHFALTIEPSGTLIPARRAVLRYRAHNAAAVASQPARVRFLVPPELLPLDGAEAECTLPPLGPGQTFVLDYPVTVASPLANGSPIDVQAVLLVDGREPLGSNIARAVVRSRARLNGPGTRVELAAGDAPDGVIVRATIANDGDAAATNTVLSLPPPLGTCSAEGSEATFALGELAPGECITVSYAARIADPLGPTLVVADATVLHDEDTAVALPPSAALALAPCCTAPRIVLERDGRRTRVRVHVTNEGWRDAEDVRLELLWPAGFRAADGSLLVDERVPARPKMRGAQCRVQHRPDGADIVLRRVARRAASVVTIDLYPSAKPASGEIRAVLTSAGSKRESTVALATPANGAFALQLVEGPNAPVDAGESVCLHFELTQAGDRAQTCTLALGDDAAVVTVAERAYRADDPLTVAPGTAQSVCVTLVVPPDTGDGAHLCFELWAIAADGARVCSRAHVPVRNRVWIDTSGWLLEDDGMPQIRLTNRGSSPARDLSVTLAAGEEPIALADIEPFATTTVALSGWSTAAVARGGVVARAGVPIAQLPPEAGAAPAAFQGEVAFAVPARAPAGVALAVQLRVQMPLAVEKLHVRVRRDDTTVPLPGSTSVNAHAVLDADGEALLYGPGLLLRGVPAGSLLEIAWSVVPHAALADGTAIAFCVELAADGSALTCESTPIALDAQQPFAPRPRHLPFHIEGIAACPADREIDEVPSLDAPQQPPSAPAIADAGLSFTLRLDAARRETIARLLRGAAMPGLVSHIFSLRALFSDDVTSTDPSIHEALALERDALRAVLDRLYVKMRIPGYDLIASDCEDITARRSMLALLTASGDEDASAALDDVPLGAPAALRAVARFLPDASGGTELGARIAQYVVALRRALDDMQDLTIGEFEERLANGTDRALDDARSLLLETLSPAPVRA